MAIRIKSVLFVLLAWCSYQAHAMSWRDWWLTPDQQGQIAMREHNYKEAALHFHDPMWAGSAAYRAGDYERAAQKFAQVPTAEGYYNLGNALARDMRLQEAIQAYDKVLKLEPKHQDALFNRALLIKSMQQQQSKNEESSSQTTKQDETSSKQPQGTQSPQNAKENENKEKPSENTKPDASKEDKASQQSSPANSKNNDTSSKPQPSQAQSASESKAQKSQKMGQAEQNKQEEQYAKQQWLQLVPDEPGGLMREKFLREHLRRQRSFE